jgi:4-alpha-glucanotransferase
VIYSGTHDNDTSLGWYRAIPEGDRQRVRDFLGCGDAEFLPRFIRCVFDAPSRLCIIPFQDVLGLDSHHRMNMPGKEMGNWKWRYTPEMIQKEKLSMIAGFTSVYGREPGPDFKFG